MVFLAFSFDVIIAYSEFKNLIFTSFYMHNYMNGYNIYCYIHIYRFQSVRLITTHVQHLQTIEWCGIITDANTSNKWFNHAIGFTAYSTACYVANKCHSYVVAHRSFNRLASWGGLSEYQHIYVWELQNTYAMECRCWGTHMFKCLQVCECVCACLLP